MKSEKLIVVASSVCHRSAGRSRKHRRCHSLAQAIPPKSPVHRPRTCSEGPFGELLRATGPLARANPLRFSTKYQDDETELLYYGYRYYSATMGRWLSRDPMEESGDWNLYGFACGNPLSHCDPLGLRHFCIIFYLENNITLVTTAAEQHLHNVIGVLNRRLRADDVRVLFTVGQAKADQIGMQHEMLVTGSGLWTKKGCPIAYGVNVEQDDRGDATTAPGGQGTHGGIILRLMGFESNVAQKAAAWDWVYSQDIAVANVMAHESIVHLMLGKRHIPGKFHLGDTANPTYIDADALTRQLIRNEGAILESTIKKLITLFKLQ